MAVTTGSENCDAVPTHFGRRFVRRRGRLRAPKTMEADNRIVETIRGSLPTWRSPGLTLNLQSFWAIADQGVVSLGNFLTTIILARALTPAAYGLWSGICGLILFL